ncbi:hypothetical protein TNCT_86771, partial [Trichonephila clavata]
MVAVQISLRIHLRSYDTNGRTRPHKLGVLGKPGEVPPGVPIIKDYNGKMLSGIIGPFNEGDSLHLICEAEG